MWPRGYTIYTASRLLNLNQFSWLSFQYVRHFKRKFCQYHTKDVEERTCLIGFPPIEKLGDSTIVRTVEPGFNEPLYNEVPDLTNDFHQTGPNYSKIYRTEPRFNEILVITNTIQRPTREIYHDITNACQQCDER